LVLPCRFLLHVRHDDYNREIGILDAFTCDEVKAVCELAGMMYSMWHTRDEYTIITMPFSFLSI
jgi:hypothetical protein